MVNNQKEQYMRMGIVLMLLCIFFMGHAKDPKEEIQVKGVVGQGLIAGSISELEARRQALNEAKVEALRRAGVSEHLQSYDMLFRSEVNMDYSEFFSSDIQSEIQGAVQQYEIVKEQRKLDSATNLFVYEVTIDARVVKYSVKPDPLFDALVTGIKGVYENEEKLVFTIQTTRDCYLNIFNITDNSTSLMYPNPWEQSKVIKAGEQINFPFGQVDYYLEKSTSVPENNRLIFVFTKEPMKYLNFAGEDQLTTAEQIFSWIYSITPDKRKMGYHTFFIR